MRDEVTRALEFLVRQEARRVPVVVVFEDLHWADEQSRELLAMALARVNRARVMAVVSSRPDESFLWHTRAAVTQIFLRPLQRNDMNGIMRSIVGGSLPASLQAAVSLEAKAECRQSLAELGGVRRWFRRDPEG